MRIVCPSCNAAYQVPEAVLAQAPEVRCARCGHNWRPVSEAPAEAPAAPVAPPAEPPPPAPPPPPEVPAAPLAEPSAANPLPLRLAWAASLLLLLGAGAAAVLWRETLVAAWPPLARLFQLLK